MIPVRFSATKNYFCGQYCTSGKIQKIIIIFFFLHSGNFPLKFDSVKLLGGMLYKPKKYNENLQSHFLDNEKFNFLNKTTHNCDGWSKTKKPPINICKRTLDKRFEWDWLIGLGAMLGDGRTDSM